MQTASREIAKMNQELVNARSRDQKQSQLKSQFLAHLEQEIRKPMEIIQQHNEQMRENHSADSTCMEYIDQIEDDSQHLLHLLDDIMHLTALNSDGFALNERKIAIRDLLEEVTNKYARQAAEKHIEMQTQIGPNVPMMIFADADRLRQILDHLIHNAVRYTKQGYVHIMAKAIPQGEYNMILRLTVEDSGIGIKTDMLEKIFDPFCKLTADHEIELLSDPAGTGMGLTICRRLALAMQGNLTVGSVHGKGSVFCLTMPTRADRPVVPIPEWNKDDSGEYELSSIDLSGKRILYVEDQYEMQKLIQKIMSKVGAKVDLADNGKVGMEIAMAAWKTGRPYDMLIVDRCMPVMDGITAVTKLREQGFAQPILLLSANASNDREKCLAAGCSALLTKPVDQDMLLRMTHKFLTRQPATQSA
jgi:CheY-like chemotaxis protein